MIRRKAQHSNGAHGFVLAWLLKVEADGSESMLMVFEFPDGKVLANVPVDQVQFMDGSPDVIAEIS